MRRNIFYGSMSVINDTLQIARIKIRQKMGCQPAFTAPPRELKRFCPEGFLPSNERQLPREVIEKYLAGEILIFGEHWLTSPIAWQRDYFSGYDFPGKHSAPSADIKTPWEIARFHHWPQVAWYLKTHENEKELIEKAKLQFQAQITDFIAKNPLNEGVNWACAMDAAIRAVNLLLAWDLFRSVGIRFEAVFEKEFSAFLWFHHNFIHSNLEWYRKARSNHYLADLAGLIFLSLYFGCEINGFYQRQFFAEIERQFLADGANFESSTYYHRLSAEIAIWGIAAVLAHDVKREIPQNVQARLAGMNYFLSQIQKPNGSLPQVGDNDSGRFLKFVPFFVKENGNWKEDTLHVGETIELLSTALGDRGSFPFSKLWTYFTFGRSLQVSATVSLPRLSPAKPEQLPHRREYFFKAKIPAKIKFSAFPDFGLYIWRGDSFFLSARCGSLYPGLNGAHAHFDQLSVDFYEDGKQILCDPGSYLYTSDLAMRNFFRSPQAHFMPRSSSKKWGVGGTDQDCFIYQDLPEGICYLADAKHFFGEYSYQGNKFQREIKIIEDGIKIIDMSDVELVDANPNLPFIPIGYRQKKEK